MRLMVVYYTGFQYKIADVSVEDPDLKAQPLDNSKVASDCKYIVGYVEVPRGVDYDKELYQEYLSKNAFSFMLIK